MKQKLNLICTVVSALFLLAGCVKDTKKPEPPIANAGNSQTIQLPVLVNPVTLNGSGTTTNGSIVSYSWSPVSGPNVPTITSPSSPSSTITGLIAGTYVIKFSVVDNVGLTGIDTVSLVVIPAEAPIANAGNSQIVQLPVNLDQVTITGTGTTKNGSIVGYAWSTVSGPNTPTITSPTTASSKINGLIAGTYVIKLTVTDNIGLSGIDTLSLVVNAAIQQTITIQPTSNPNDAHVDSYNPAGGAGDTEIEIGGWTIYGTATSWRSYLKFDQSQIPTASTIISATLYLYSMPVPHSGDGVNANYGTANSFYVERITGTWSPSTLAWSNLPISTAVNKATVPQSTAAFQDITINVTNIVQDMLVNGNYGFAFLLQNEVPYNFRTFASSTYSNAALHPKLVITYQ